MKRILAQSLTLFLSLTIIFSAFPAPSQAAVSYQTLYDQAIQLQAAVRALNLSGTPKVLGTQSIAVANNQELFAALQTVTGGETILLAPGEYDRIMINSGQYNQLLVGSLKAAGKSPKLTAPVKITSADPTRRAILRGIEIRTSDYWHLEGVSVFPVTRAAAVKLNGNNLKVINNNISFGNNSDDWDAATWISTAGNGVQIGGNNNEVAYNYIKNISFGISEGGTNSRIHHNYITDFSQDGARGLGSYGLWEHNVISNPVLVDGNHYDGFQSWATNPDGSKGGVVKGTVLRNNTFLHSTRDNPLRAAMQGIGMFDGMYEDWIIENNLLAVNHYHGINVSGATNVIIRNNVAIDPVAGRPGPTWIRSGSHKDGRKATGGEITNNYANATFATQGTSSDAVKISGNTIIPPTTYANYFADPANNNFTPKSGAFPFVVGAQLDMNQIAPAPIFVGTSTTATIPTPAPTPTITLTTSTSSVISGGGATLNWNTTNATACTASGSWSGTKAVNGTQSTGALQTVGTQTYTLSCTGAGGSVTKSVSVLVAPVTSVTPTTPATTTTIGTPFNIGDRVSMTKNVNVRTAGLISTATLIGVNPQGSVGTITAGPTFSNDRFGAITWFTVNFDTGFDGWVGADNYVKVVTPAPTPTPVPTDTDADTVPDTNDNCVSVFNRNQANADRDAQGDVCDADDDNDGIADTQEKSGCQFNAASSCGATPTPVPSTTPNVTTTANLNVRSTAGGTLLGIQPLGATGISASSTQVTLNGTSWIYVDFSSGLDGYVSTTYLTGFGVASNNQALISSLLAQLAILQAALAALLAQ